jgi:hypothetical protein
MAADTTSATALDLTVDIPRATVAIQRVPYELRTDRDFSPFEWHRLEHALLPRTLALSVLYQSPAFSEADSQELDALLVQIADIALVAPADVKASLAFVDRMELFAVFMARLLPRFRKLREMATGNLLDTTKFSRDSNATTAATPRRGSPSRSGRSNRS